MNIILNYIIFMHSEDYEYDSDDSYSEIVYEPEEPSQTRFCIALCELYNVTIQGPTTSPSTIDGNYLVNCRYKTLCMDWIEETSDFIHAGYRMLNSYHHHLFPNYRSIVLREDYIKPEIVECMDKDGYCVAIIKTCWIKIIQRTWKNIMKKREEALKCRRNLLSILYKEINGKWPIHCYATGGLLGLLRLHR